MIELVLRNGLSLPNSTYYVDGPVNEQMAGNLARALHVLDSLESPITIYLSTPGGDRAAGIGMYDLIVACKSPTTIIGYGEVASMGVLILQAGKTRLLTPNCQLLVHSGHAQTGFDMDENIHRQAISAKKSAELVYNVIGKRIGLSGKEMATRYQWDTYLTAKQAIAAKLADGIFKG